MDARWVRDTYALDLAVVQGCGVPWRPEPDGACWCGDVVPYAECCASRVPPKVRAVAREAYDDGSRFF